MKRTLPNACPDCGSDMVLSNTRQGSRSSLSGDTTRTFLKGHRYLGSRCGGSNREVVL